MERPNLYEFYLMQQLPFFLNGKFDALKKFLRYILHMCSLLKSVI